MLQLVSIRKPTLLQLKGPKGELSQKIDPSIIVENNEGTITFSVDEKSPVNVKQKQAFMVSTAH